MHVSDAAEKAPSGEPPGSPGAGAAMSDWEPIELRMTFERLEQIIRADEQERIAVFLDEHGMENAAWFVRQIRGIKHEADE